MPPLSRGFALGLVVVSLVSAGCSSGGERARGGPGPSGFFPTLGDCPTRLVQSGLSVELFARPGAGSCLGPGELITYRCSARSDPVALVGRRVYLGGRFAVPAESPSGGRQLGSGPGGSVAVLGPGRVPRLLIGSDSGLERWLSLPRRGRPSSDSSVFLLGDSILVASERVLRLSLSTWRITFDAAVGRSTAGGISALSRRVAELGNAVVIELGTNDRTSSRFARRAAALLRLVADTPLVVWVTVHGPDPPVPAVNGEIRLLAAEFPNAAVADWDRAVTSGGLRGDGIHPNRVGKAALAHLLERVLDSWRAAVSGRGDRACEHDARTLAREASS